MKFILISLLLIPLIYIVIAFALVFLPFNREKPDKSLDFDALHVGSLVGTAANENHYTARDGSEIFYRFLPGKANVTVVLIHGSGAEGRYLLPLAEKLNASLGLSVVIPDLRGHGRSALGNMGDIGYLGQLEHDLEDLKRHIASNFPDSKIIVGGHSSGGGLVVKYGGSELDQFDGYILLAPYLGYKAPTVRPNSGGWVQVRKARYAGLDMLNNIGFNFFNYLPVLYFNRPESVNDELQLDSYSFRMNESFSPQSYVDELKANEGQILALVGECDEAFYAHKFESIFSENAQFAEFNLVKDARHLDLPDAEESVSIMVKWLDKMYNASLQHTSR